MVFFEFAITGRWEGELVSSDGIILAQGKLIESMHALVSRTDLFNFG
jgi:hypothetical protein